MTLDPDVWRPKSDSDNMVGICSVLWIVDNNTTTICNQMFFAWPSPVTEAQVTGSRAVERQHNIVRVEGDSLTFSALRAPSLIAIDTRQSLGNVVNTISVLTSVWTTHSPPHPNEEEKRPCHLHSLHRAGTETFTTWQLEKSKFDKILHFTLTQFQSESDYHRPAEHWIIPKEHMFSPALDLLCNLIFFSVFIFDKWFNDPVLSLKRVRFAAEAHLVGFFLIISNSTVRADDHMLIKLYLLKNDCYICLISIGSLLFFWIINVFRFRSSAAAGAC